jgi:membrane-bound ClpP family serine protease
MRWDRRHRRNKRTQWRLPLAGQLAPRQLVRATGIATVVLLASYWAGWWGGGYHNGSSRTAHAQDAPAPAADAPAAAAPVEAAADSQVVRFDVPLPIDGLVDSHVQSRVEQALRKRPKEGPRPTFVFEFRPKDNTAGEGNDFERSLSLARYLCGDRLSGVRTVAWLPRSVKGHAVLPVLACEQIIVQKEAELGAAGNDERGAIDALTRRCYQEIADRRKTIPAAIALGMLDKDLGVFKVKTPDGLRYELPDGLQSLLQEGKVTSEVKLFQPGDPHVLSGAQLRELGFATHLADDRRSLAAALDVPMASLQQQLVPEEGWRPLRLDVSGPIHRQMVNFLLRTIDDHVRRNDFNLLLLDIRSGGGDLDESRRLAEKLANLGPQIHSVAFVDSQALSDAALIATACDELLVTDGAMLGGPGERSPSRDELAGLRGPLPGIFRAADRDWSLPLALVDPEVQVFRFTRTVGGDIRFLSLEELETLPDRNEWNKGEQPVPTASGITGATAAEWGLARSVVHNFDDAKSLFQIEGELPTARPNWALTFVEWLADPKIAGFLLFVGIFALIFEMSTPGVGVPGFIAGLCFLLFFWAHILHGTAGWLEVLLFVGGVLCLAIELFILPGMGIFGIGGGLMIITSIVLASQTFVVPTNEYQLRQFPVSLLMVASGLAGGLAAIAAIRRFLPDTPYFNRMMLKPPAGEEREELSRRESLAIFDHLPGKRGQASTPLVPAGKALFGDELVDVRSDGEFLPKGTPVIVADVTGSIVVVKRAPDA